MDRDQLTARILEFIASEVSEKSLQITLDTPVEAIKMDSIDVIHVIFKAEEEFDVEIDISQQTKFEKVGDFVDELLKFIEKRKASPAPAARPGKGALPAAAARRSKPATQPKAASPPSKGGAATSMLAPKSRVVASPAAPAQKANAKPASKHKGRKTAEKATAKPGGTKKAPAPAKKLAQSVPKKSDKAPAKSSAKKAAKKKSDSAKKRPVKKS